VETSSKERIMGLVAWILLGVSAGAIAKTLRDRREPGGLLGTLGVGVVGAVLGGLIASGLGDGSIGSFFNVGTWLIAIGGAFVLLMLVEPVVSRDEERRDAGVDA
jgi:uncharacterized membrane protein YeaQ/YmgE (transglycosylase-associated protein family)